MPSLQGKIVQTYVFSKLVMFAFALVVFFDLYYLYYQIEAGRFVADFREATLEMRRDEKNLFLYRDPSSLDHLFKQIEQARAILAAHRSVFETVGGAVEYLRLRDALERYAAALWDMQGQKDADADAARESVRQLGHALSDASERLSQREREILANSMRTAGVVLLAAFIAVVLLGVAGGSFLARRVVRSLRALQAGVAAIESGRAHDLPLPSRDREIESFVLAFNAMLKRLRQQQEQAKRREKAAALGVLVSGVAHELNNPLSNISTSVQLLLEEGDADPELKRLWLVRIDGETERARRIVRRLLDCVRPTRMHMHAVALNELVRAALNLVERQLPAGVRLQVGSLAAHGVYVDRDRLLEAIINLVRNAAEAGARQISIDAGLAVWEEKACESGILEGDPAALREAGQGVRIVVRDDGPGVAPEARAHVFEPFFSTRVSGEGLGLGLYLVAEIVNEHRGCIVLESPLQGGASFTLWLPIAEAEAAA